MSARRFVGVVVWVFVLGACASSEDVLDRSACERLREHLIDLRLQGIDEDLDAHRAAAQQVLGPDFVTTCAASTPSAELECSLAAKSLASVHDCKRGR